MNLLIKIWQKDFQQIQPPVIMCCIHQVKVTWHPSTFNFPGKKKWNIYKKEFITKTKKNLPNITCAVSNVTRDLLLVSLPRPNCISSSKQCSSMFREKAVLLCVWFEGTTLSSLWLVFCLCFRWGLFWGIAREKQTWKRDRFFPSCRNRHPRLSLQENFSRSSLYSICFLQPDITPKHHTLKWLFCFSYALYPSWLCSLSW